MSAPRMTRCECAEITFEQIADQADRAGLDEFALLCRKTGCASTCTACQPDLEAFLAERGKRTAAAAP